MNLKQEFAKILETYGYPVLIIRQSKKLRCSCWNEKTQEADRTCPVCFGLGWTPYVEKHQSRGEDNANPLALGALTQLTGPGNMNVPSRKWFLYPNALVQVKDLIVSVDWVNNRPVYNGKGIYEINHIDDTMLLQSSEQIYKIAYCKDTPVNKSIRGIRIAESQGIINYELAMEDI